MEPARQARARRIVAILADNVLNGYQNTVLFGASEALREEGATVIFFAGGVLQSTDPLSSERNAIYNLVAPGRMDAVILLSPLGNHIGAAALSRFCARFGPVPLCSLSVQMPNASCVVVDDQDGMARLLEHIIVAHGRRRVGFVRGPAGNVEAERRYAAYCEALACNGIDFDPARVVVGDFDARSGAEAVRVLCDERRVAFDALVAANDYMALGAMAALQSRGVDIPGQVAVAGFDDIEEARFATPPLTTVRQPLYESGREAARLVLQMLRNEPCAMRVTLQTELSLRESCGCLADQELADLRPDSLPWTESLSRSLVERRSELVGKLAACVPLEQGRIPCDWPQALFDAFAADVENVRSTMLASFLRVTLRRVIVAGGSVRAWQAAIAVLNDASRTVGDPAGMRRADTLCEGARVLIGDLRERVQAQHRIQRERWIRTLHETSEALLTAVDTRSLVAAIAQQLPRLEISACSLALYDNEAVGDSLTARSLLVYDNGAVIEPDDRTGVFPACDLAPSPWMEARARTLIAGPLVSRGEQLGFALFEVGPHDGIVYESLRELVSAALQGARLVERVVEDATQRQRVEKARLQREIEIAARIQTTIVPKTIAVPGLDIAAAMIPATEVGGDYYDVIPFQGGCWIGIGDVAGHGLQAGLVMLMIQSIVAALVRQAPSASPCDLIRHLNSVLFDNVRRRMGQDEHATLSLLRYDGEGRFVFAGAHEEIVVHRAALGACEHIATPGPWVGARPELGKALVDSALTLGPADVMVLHTDGVTEAMNASGVQFGLERLCAIVDRVSSQSAAAIRDQVVYSVRRWASVQQDDVSVVVVRRKPSPGDS
ncbi:MAG: SpoIIE family protein phosphatase [Myxococcota bacterium]|nr:SpoIIE family protein phosphatase [Myxococcota bacterium]